MVIGYWWTVLAVNARRTCIIFGQCSVPDAATSRCCPTCRPQPISIWTWVQRFHSCPERVCRALFARNMCGWASRRPCFSSRALLTTVVRGSRFSPAFVCSFVFQPNISKTDAARITKVDMETFHDESWKAIYFGIKRSKVKVKKSAGVVLCTLVSAGFFQLSLIFTAKQKRRDPN